MAVIFLKTGVDRRPEQSPVEQRTMVHEGWKKT